VVRPIETAISILKEPPACNIPVVLRKANEDSNEPVISEHEAAILVIIVSDPDGLQCEVHATLSAVPSR
jgi:hypothetical protein